MSKNINMKDSISMNDSISYDSHIPNLWAKTEIEIGYGYNRVEEGKSYLEENIWTGSNTVPIGGVQSALQYLFGVQGPIVIPTLYDEMKAGHPNIEYTDSPKDTYLKPDHSVENSATSGATTNTTIYRVGHFVQLFGVGITGTAENNITVHKVGYRETSINADGIPNGVMLPFRYTASELDGAEKTKYFGKKLDEDTGATAYYLKRFEGVPEVKHIWKTQDTMDSESEVLVNNANVFDSTRNDAIQSFVEIHLQITKKDLKEFFADKLEQPESCRFNSIALYDGYYTEDDKPLNEVFGDYANVRLFSKLNIPTEHLTLQKDLEIIYRVYGS